MKKLLIIIGMILTGSLNAFAQDDISTEKAIPFGVKDSNGIYTLVDKMPSYPGGEKEKMSFLGKTMKYPVMALEYGIMGTVIVGFVVQIDGSISQIEIIKGVDKDLDAEATRAVKEMPKWDPGEHNNEKVPVYVTLPIKFQVTHITTKLK